MKRNVHRLTLRLTLLVVAAVAVLFAAPSSAAAADGVDGTVDVVLDYTTTGQVDIRVDAQMLSTDPVYVVIEFDGPGSSDITWGPDRFEGGQSRTYTGTVMGCACDHLTNWTGNAFAYDASGNEVWSLGTSTSASPFVTIVGCGETASPPASQPTPLSQPAAQRATVEATPLSVPVAQSIDQPPAAQTAASLPATGGTPAAVVGIAIAAALLLIAGVGALVVRRPTS